MSLDAARFAEMMKQAALLALDERAPFAFCIGTVVSPEPSLRVRVEQRLVLSEKQLLLTNAVRDYYVKLSTCGESTGQADGTAHTTEHSRRPPAAPEDYGAFDSHDHEYKGDKWFKVNLKLKAGESVLLLRIDGGQKYIILDRLEAPKNA
ncbi:MAG: DUF2577 domain-containing protein [Clostridia bacterium]|nr:DUF2577 domain-containing protein [Clostridia bacterium]